MKNKMISYMSSIENELYDLCKYLYSNPEESYKEFKANEYIGSLLKKNGFKITDDFLGITNSFYAEKGAGYPKICYICEYDSVPGEGHITGHNLLSEISIGAALTLGNIIEKINGSVVVIGCPGEYLGGTKATMARQGVFDDIDVVLMCHPDIVTSESGSSSAIIALNVRYTGNSGLSFLNKGMYTSLDGILIAFNIINSIIKGFPDDVEVNSILSKGGFTPLLLPIESEAKFYIRGKDMESVEIVERKIREITGFVSTLIHVKHSISFYEPPSDELITNRTLNRLFSHNLKESGEIHIGNARDIYAGLSLGSVSKKVPCIHPYIKVIDDDSIKYGSKAFELATLSKFAQEQARKASLALAYTGLDLLTKEHLLMEVKNDFYKSLQ